MANPKATALKGETKKDNQGDDKSATTETAAPSPVIATKPGFDPTKLKVKREVTLPLLKQEDGSTIYVKILSPVFKGKEIKQKREGAEMAPADLMIVHNIAVGRNMEMIANAVLKGNLQENYPNDGYVGLCFQITRHKLEGKRYKAYEIVEIEEPAGLPAPVPAPKRG